MTNAQASKRRAGTVLTIVGALMLPLGFFVIASWRDESGAALPIGVTVIVAGIATGVVGLLLRWGRRQQ
jgi:hypothetical protein